jgi:hypothetical protein
VRKEKDQIADQDIETVDIVEEDMLKNVINFTSQKLADIIIMHQYLGLYQQVSAAAMQELASRRHQDDPFEYETYISTNLEKLPKLKIDLGNINNLVEKLKKIL